MTFLSNQIEGQGNDNYNCRNNTTIDTEKAIYMKIAIATESADVSSEVSTQGARALHYLIFDGNGNLKEIIANPYVGDEKSVGPNVAILLAQMGVNKVIAGRFGSKFKEVLEQNKIECIVNTGFAAQLIKDLIQ